MADVYKKNLAALRKGAPGLYEKLRTVTENRTFEVFVGKDPIDINILNTETRIPLYNEPVSETVAKLQEMGPFTRYPFLCFFGIGNGVFFKALLDTPGFSHIVVVEPELELIYIALNFMDFSAHIESGKFLLLYSGDFTKREAIRFATLPDIGVYIKLYDIFL